MSGEKRRIAAALLLTAGLTCVLAAQEPIHQTQTPRSIMVDVDVVLATATVTDRDGRFVTGLEKENFTIAEDKVPQDIVYFSSEDAPVSVGIIFDVSGSMKDKMKTAVQAAMTFMRNGSPDDEYFMIEFSDKPTEASDFTSDIAKIQRRFMFSKAKGRTALYDAVYMGLNKLEEGTHTKRALLLITDGEDNRSRYTFSNVKEFVKEKDIQMYAIGISTSFDSAGEQGRSLLRDLASMTGGNSFFPPSTTQLENICKVIALELKNQYVIGYQSSNSAKDGKWRKIKVTAEYPRNKLNVRAKQGYYAPRTEASAAKN